MSYLGKVALKASDIRRLNVTSSTSATHTLSWTPPNEQSLIITINGVKQQNNYTISGTTLTLDTALTATDAMEVVGINDIGTTNVPGSGVITNDMVSPSAAIAQSKLATLAIDTAELADDAVTADKLANSINTEIAANTAKVTNATHTGDVTGATALTIAAGAVDLAMLSATGTASASNFLRGDNSWAAAGGGKVLQVVQGVLTTATSTTSNSYVDLCTVSITPSAATSKVWCNFSTYGGTEGDVSHGYVILTREDTEIFSATSTGSRTGASGVMNNATMQQYFMGGSFLDSPNKTSATTYKIRFKTSNTYPLYINRSHRDTNLAAYDGRTPTQITVMEIGA